MAYSTMLFTCLVSHVHSERSLDSGGQDRPGALFAESDRAGRISPEVGLACPWLSLAAWCWAKNGRTGGLPHTKCRDTQPFA